MKEWLRRIPMAVPLARLVRETSASWTRIRERDAREVTQSALLAARRRTIAAYFAERKVPRGLQIGTGTNPLTGWLNTDLEPEVPGVIAMDALEPFPFNDHVFDYLFSEHMIEHIPYVGGLSMLREACRVLKPLGRIRVATPDVTRIAGLLTEPLTNEQQRYIRWSAVESLGLYASHKSMLQQRKPEWDIDPHHIRRFFPDESRDCSCFVVNNFFRSYGHQFLYDERTLTAALQAAGFVDVIRASPGESDTEALRWIDAHARLIGTANNEFETMVLEATRP